MVQIRVISPTPIMIQNKLRRPGNVLNVTEATYKRVLEQFPNSIVLTNQPKMVAIREIVPPVVIPVEDGQLSVDIDDEPTPQKVEPAVTKKRRVVSNE